MPQPSKTNSDLPYTITLVAGDWSHDGHSISHNEWIKSNLTSKEIQKAYKKGVKKIGVDLSEDICRGYGERTIEYDDLIKFVNLGYKVPAIGKKRSNKKEDIEYWCVEFNIELFLELYLFTVHIGNEKFKHSIIKDESDNINIGGYGLFGN